MKTLIAFIIGTALLASCSGAKGKPAEIDAATGTTAASTAFTANADSLYRFVEKQVALGPRVPGSEAHSLCADMIVEHLHACGIDSVAQQSARVTTFDGNAFTARNIMGCINPDASNRLLLLAHYDTRPWADNDPDASMHSTPIDGANDGASGVAVLMETARVMGNALPDSIGVDLLFVDLEDSGESNGDENSWCLGTQEWVKQMPYTNANRPKFGILLDMVGAQGARFHREYFSQQHAARIIDRVWAVAARNGFADIFVNSPGGAVVDDHVHINRAGIPCIDIIESYNSHTGSFNPTWHTTADNISAIDRSTLRAVTQTVFNTIAQ